MDRAEMIRMASIIMKTGRDFNKVGNGVSGIRHYSLSYEECDLWVPFHPYMEYYSLTVPQCSMEEGCVTASIAEKRLHHGYKGTWELYLFCTIISQFEITKLIN